ncbi:MAG: hypothetical protein AAGA68_15010 [Pseudomonadota bacterium]
MEIADHASLVLIALGFYVAMVIGLALYYSRRTGSTEDFILAGHSLSAPFVCGSVVATWLGGAVVIGSAREAYVGGFQAIVWDPWSPMLTLLFCGFFMVAVFRRSRFTTAIDFYNARFDERIGICGLFIHVLSYLSWISAQLLSLGVIIALVTGLSAVPATLLGAVVILSICLTGGLWALSRSDMLAFIILTAVLLIVLPYALSAVGGISGFIEQAGTVNGTPPFSLFYTTQPNAAGEPTGFAGYLGLLGIIYMFAAWFSVAFGDLGGSVLVARALAAKDERAASRGFVFGGLIYIVLGMIPVIVGMCAFIVNANVPEAQLDNVFPNFVQEHLPGWVTILFFVAASSAIISTAGDTVLTSGALLGYTLLRVVKPQADDRLSLIFTRVAMVAFTCLGLLFGLAMGDLYNLLVFGGAVAFPTIAATFVCGVLWKGANVTGALASMAMGAFSWVILAWVLLPHTGGEIWDAIYIGAVPAFLLSFTTIVVVSLLTRKSCPPKPARDIDGNDISGTRLFTW